MKRIELEVFRTRQQLTQEEMGNKLGISKSLYCMIENGQREPSIALAYKIQEVFGVDNVLKLFEKSE